MPKPPAQVPITLRPFVTHGVDFSRTDTSEVEGECPFCGRRRLYVKVETGQWDCKVCDVQGNVYGFLARVFSESWQRGSVDYSWLQENREIPAGHLRAMGVCKSVTTGEWIVPGYGSTGTVVNLYRYRNVGDRWAVIPSPSWEKDKPHHGYYREYDVPTEYEYVDICEGVWDCAAWRWALSEADPSRLEKTLILGTPGCNVFNDSWGTKLCAGKIVTILYDNDHPRVNPNSGVTTQPALNGVKRVATTLATCGEPPSEIRYLAWGGESQYHDGTLKDGYDLRDLVHDEDSYGWNLAEYGDSPVKWVDDKVRTVPPDWITLPSFPKVITNVPDGALTPLTCNTYSDLIGAWKSADHHTNDFEGGLVFALAVAASIDYGECQLWGKLIGVGSTGKSTVCDGLGVAAQYVISDSSVNDLYSGAIREDGKDHSFAARLRQMCWVNNDGDVLLRNPNREKLLAQMRELYGGKGGKAFNNGIGSRSYVGLRFTSLIAGTHSLKELDSADLGGRYIDYVFEEPSEEIKRRIGLAAIRHQTSGSVSKSGMTPAKEQATRMTGGYLCHLRERGLSAANSIRPTDQQAERIYLLADYVAKMRSRPPKTQDEHVDNVEMPTRLCKQLSTLAVYAAVVRGRPAIDIAAMNLVRRVALDTAAGRTQRIVSAIGRAGSSGLDMPGILVTTRKTPDREHELVSYLTEVGMLEEFGDGYAHARRARWRLSESFGNVYRSVFPTGGVK